MIKKLKEQYPAWVNVKGDYNLCMSDDLDSHFSSSILHSLFGYKVSHFYDFENIYSTVPLVQGKTICVDIAVENGKTWDNHVVKIHKDDKVNPESANINAIKGINRDNYYTKYAGSTLLQIISYYDFPIPKSREAQLILLDIDSSYLGHYHNDYKAIHRRYMKELELFDLIDLLDSETYTQAFRDVRNKYKLNGKIWIENGKLETTIDLAGLQSLFDVDLALSEERFTKSFEFNEPYSDYANDDTFKPNVFSFALTGRNKFKYTTGGRSTGAVS